MFRKQRMALASVAAVGVLAVVAPGLTAVIGVPDGNDVPAAGQGVAELQGFTVTDINWEISEPDIVTEVSFIIVRTVGGANVETAGADANAVVRVRLEGSGDPAEAAWQDCDVTTGAAVCTLATAAEMPASDLEKVNIIAFDSN